MKRVKCANCGMVWDYIEGPMEGQPYWVDPSFLNRWAAQAQERCPKCGSNAYNVIADLTQIATDTSQD